MLFSQSGGRSLRAIFALLLASIVALTSVMPVAAAPSSVVQYTKSGRTMVYVNNPELLQATELAEVRIAGTTKGPSLLTVDLGQGNYRDYFEHLNQTGATVGYGVYIWNPTNKKVTITRRAKGWAAGDYQIGAKPLVQLFSGSESTVLTLDPATNTRGGWIYRSDVAFGTTAGVATNGQFLTGAFDFDITVANNAGEKVVVQQLVYTASKFSTLPGSYQYIGYIKRMRDSGDPESRTYKGTSTASEVQANLNFNIGSADGIQDLTVSYADYEAINAAGDYGPSSTTYTGRRWYTHDIPARDKAGAPGVANDMLSFNMPGWGMVNPLTKSSDGATYPNLGNWGVLYRHTITINNTSGRDRYVAVKAGIYDGPSSDNAFFAYKGDSGVWGSNVVRDGATVTYRTLRAPAGVSTHDVYFILGAPSDGHLFHVLSLTN